MTSPTGRGCAESASLQAQRSEFDRGSAVAALRISIGATRDAKQLESALRLVASLVTHRRMTTATVV